MSLFPTLKRLCPFHIYPYTPHLYWLGGKHDEQPWVEELPNHLRTEALGHVGRLLRTFTFQVFALCRSHTLASSLFLMTGSWGRGRVKQRMKETLCKVITIRSCWELRTIKVTYKAHASRPRNDWLTRILFKEPSWALERFNFHHHPQYQSITKSKKRTRVFDEEIPQIALGLTC